MGIDHVSAPTVRVDEASTAVVRETSHTHSTVGIIGKIEKDRQPRKANLGIVLTRLGVIRQTAPFIETGRAGVSQAVSVSAARTGRVLIERRKACIIAKELEQARRKGKDAPHLTKTLC